MSSFFVFLFSYGVIFAGYMVNNLLGDMEKHVKILEKLCWICRQKIVKSKGYINPKDVSAYSEVLQELFSVSVNKETEEVNFTFTWRFDVYKLNIIKKWNKDLFFSSSIITVTIFGVCGIT